MNTLPIFDPSYLEILIELEETPDPTQVIAIVDQYKEDAVSLFVRLEKTLASGDLPAAADLAHSLKGGSAQLGLVRLAKIAHTIEDSAKKGLGDGLFPLLIPALETYEAGLIEIDTLLKAPKSGATLQSVPQG